MGKSSSHPNITSSEPQMPARYSTAVKNNQSSNTPFNLKLNWASLEPRPQRIEDGGGEISMGESSSNKYLDWTHDWHYLKT